MTIVRALENTGSVASPPPALLTHWFEEHRKFLWGLCYRITGSAADADDVVQETFIRAMEHTPSRLDAPRPWLVRVAVNVARDLLRRRKRRAYVGQWLPTPIVTSGEEALPSYEPAIDGTETAEGRYDLMESVSLAFLQALEALTPTQRAVLLLRDVFDYSPSEVANALEMSEGNARTIHHRARKAMAAYDRQRSLPTASNQARTQQALRHFLELLGAGDVRGIERMLARDIVALTDGGGQFTATLHPITGPMRVARFFARLAASRSGAIHVAFQVLNGFPAVVFDFEPSTRGRRAPRLVLSADVDGAGQIHRLRAITNPLKLAAVSRSH
jgi:RNA polymerase sigma factor (sigma-70 family)